MNVTGLTIFYSWLTGVACHYSEQTGIFTFVVRNNSYSYSAYRVNPPFKLSVPYSVPVLIAQFDNLYLSTANPIFIEVNPGEYLLGTAGNSVPPGPFSLYQGVTFNVNGSWDYILASKWVWDGVSPYFSTGMLYENPYYDGSFCANSDQVNYSGGILVVKISGIFLDQKSYIASVNRGQILTTDHPVGSYALNGNIYSLDGRTYTAAELPGAYVPPAAIGTYANIGLHIDTIASLGVPFSHRFRNDNGGGYGRAWGGGTYDCYYYPRISNLSGGYRVSDLTYVGFDSITNLGGKIAGIRPDEKSYFASRTTTANASIVISRFSNGTNQGAQDARVSIGGFRAQGFSIGRSGQNIFVGGLMTTGGVVLIGAFDNTLPIPIPISSGRRVRRNRGAMPFFPPEIADYL